MFLTLTKVMKVSSLVLLTFLLLGSALSNCYSQDSQNRYPNELPGYRFYPTAKWKSLEPLISTIADVRKAMGKPTREIDLSQYFEPYPGDASAKSPLLTYDHDGDWEVLVYFGRHCFPEAPALSPTMSARLCTIELSPKKRIAFSKIKLPESFNKVHASGVDAAWDEFADGSGLAYHIYTTRTPYGDEQPGDLNRIVYGPSNKTLREHASKQ